MLENVIDSSTFMKKPLKSDTQTNELIISLNTNTQNKTFVKVISFFGSQIVMENNTIDYSHAMLFVRIDFF